MNATFIPIVLILAMMLMVSTGVSKKRLEWRPRRVRIRIRRHPR